MAARLLSRSCIPFLAATVLTSCSGPSLTILDRPVEATEIQLALTSAGKLEKANLDTLRREGLNRLYNRDAGEAIAELAKRHEQQPTESRRRALAEMAADTADALVGDDPLRAVGHYLDAARLTGAQALDDTASATESPDRTLYRYSAAQVARILQKRIPESRAPMKAPGALRTYELLVEQGAEFVTPWQFDLVVPAEWLKFDGIDLDPVTQDGFGMPMVGHRVHTAELERTDPLVPPSGYTHALNASLRFSGARASLVLQDLMVRGHREIGGRTVQLAGDFTAALAFLYHDRRKQSRGILATLRPGDFRDTIGLYSLEPFREDKIPLILVHGLLSTAEGWYPFVNLLRADPMLRENYQIILFNYPTGNTIGFSARELRDSLESYRAFYHRKGREDLMKRSVMLGHSMGGILTNIQIRSSGDRVERALLGKPIEKVAGSASKREELESLLVFNADPDVTRAILIAAPHRGSGFASNPIGQIGSWLIRLPFDIMDSFFGELLIVDALTDVGQNIVKRPQNSVTSLRTDNPVLPMILDLPVKQGVSVHSIIARKQVDRPLHESSDGVVPYTSARLERVASESVVPGATHTSVLERSECIEEVLRILYLHAGKIRRSHPRDANTD